MRPYCSETTPTLWCLMGRAREHETMLLRDNSHPLVCELHVAGYKFSVLNNAFLVHKGLKTAGSFHSDKDLDQERNRVLFRHFKLELREKYPESSRRCY
uniref:Beta-1,4-glucuronyltransferase 1 n=1 Tax=Timema genevievae TaxID=629358 RepID=A0A7R9JX59_TIMGE|nr:unnamed protein product [Timema genevievae]